MAAATWRSFSKIAYEPDKVPFATAPCCIRVSFDPSREDPQSVSHGANLGLKTRRPPFLPPPTLDKMEHFVELPCSHASIHALVLGLSRKGAPVANDDR